MNGTALPVAAGWPGVQTSGKPADWTARLAVWGQLAARRPFVWGETDCAILCFEAVEIQGVSGLAAQHRGRYRSMFDAMRYQIAADIDLARALERAGLTQVEAFSARYGDILIGANGPFECGHVCFGDISLSADPDEGVLWQPTRKILQAGAEVAYTVSVR